LRTEPDTPRSIYRFSRLYGELKNPVQESRLYDPRERPWYKVGQATNTQTWTSIYIDFKSLQLVSTRARRVNNAAGEFEGVVATDLFLEHLNVFLKRLKLTTNGFAFIVEADGNMVATSRGPHLRKGVGEDNTRLNAAASDDPLIVATYKAVKELTARGDTATSFSSSAFTAADGSAIQTGYARLRDAAGLDWIIAVAVPRSDFLQTITENAMRTVWMALVACILIGLVGIVVLNRIAKELRSLAIAAGQMGEGVLDARIPVDRKDEIGDLARSFAGMQQKLLTDKLTGIANRESVIRRIEDRILRHRRRGDSRPFAVLFVDLNKFKQINDLFGHEVGDRVLSEIAQRLTSSMRDTDMAARYGGDEFVVLLENVANRADAISARDKLEGALMKPLQSLEGIAGVTSDALSVSTGAAIGIALCPEDGQDLETLLKRADDDMYQRKQAPAEGRA
jgi:diguanylate cyclase (GGDEF)-like protein